MNDVELYNVSNAMQRDTSLPYLKKYIKKMKWANHQMIIDIGSGDGNTTNLLKSHIPVEHLKIIGIDINPSMVNYANKNYASKDIIFTVLNIEGEIKPDMKAVFDHAFSTYVLHWIRIQEYALANIYDMLVEGGDCLLILVAHNPIYDVYRILSKYNKWNIYMKDVDRYISPYHDSKDPEKDVKCMMEKIGYTDIEVKIEHTQFGFHDMNELKKALTAINPFRIPKDLYDEFFEDYLALLKNMRLVDIENNNLTDSITVTFNYTLLVIYGCKRKYWVN